MKYHSILLMAGLALAGCGRPGGGQADKVSLAEWRILIGIEMRHRGQPIRGIEYAEKDGYQIISLMATDQKTRLWIMADPKRAPFYKQLPTDHNFILTKRELDDICDRSSVTVQTVLESHLGDNEPHQHDKDNAEPIVGDDGKPALQR